MLSISSLLGMTLWFSATAVIPQLQSEWNLTESGVSWLTMSVQLGFVAGTLISAFFNISDIVNTRYLFAGSAIVGAILNASIAMYSTSIESAVIFRFLTGACLAGVYPPGMKIMATWFKKGRGMAIGTMVGALTIGSASPHLFKFVGVPDWKFLMYVASICSVVSGLICLFFITEGPYKVTGAKFNWKNIWKILSNEGVRLANFGYLGHMWELYAVWTWIPLFLFESFTDTDLENALLWSAGGAFAVISSGGIGCVLAGLLADKIGREKVTIWSMVISGCCCLVVGFMYGMSPYLIILVCLIWGFTIVADSAQFSASITEQVDPAYTGTALTLQTSMGFVLTMVSIRLIPYLVELVTWKYAFSFLAIGPVFGIWAMARLKKLND